MIFSIAALAFSALSAGVGAYAQYQAGQAQADAYEAQANNQRIAARNAELEAAEQRQRERSQNKRQIAAIRARLANSGQLTTTGTPLAILGEASSNLNQGIRDATRKASIEASAAYYNAELSDFNASQSRSAASIGAVSTLFSGAAQTASLATKLPY